MSDTEKPFDSGSSSARLLEQSDRKIRGETVKTWLFADRKCSTIE